MEQNTAISVRIPAADGFGLAASLFRCRRPHPLGALVIAAAVGNVRQNYADYAASMAGRGWDVIAFDYRGIGASRAPREREAAFTMLDWGEKDLTGVLAWARGELHPRRLVLVGHSIGGQIAAFATNHAELDTMVGVAAQRGYWRYWPGLRKYLLYLFWRVGVPLCLKSRGCLPLTAVGLENIPWDAASEWARWGLDREYQDAGGLPLRPRFVRFTAPILAISFSDDRSLAPRRAVDALFGEHYVGVPVTRWHVCPEDLGLKELGHSGFFHRKAHPERLWHQTLEWILETCSGERRRKPCPCR